MAIYLTARFHIRPQAVDECKQAIKELVEYTEKYEPGTLLYLAQQEILNPRIFTNSIIFENNAAMLLHQNSKAADRFVSTVYPHTIEPVEFKEHNLVALKR